MGRLVFVIAETGKAQDASAVPDARVGVELPGKSSRDGFGVLGAKILDLP